jgi:NTP pyrophosphatase (non-canonical NTP hydrolase)
VATFLRIRWQNSVEYAEAAPYLQEPDPTAALLVLLEEAACRRQAALSLEEVVERLAQLPAGELPALTWHLQARLAPELEYLDPGVAEGIVQLRAEELQELARWVREQRAQKA